jgi:hypothetical protein
MNHLSTAAAVVTLLIPGAAPDARSAAGSTAIPGPPWISIEYPANPHDQSTRDAYLVVHAYHHGDAMAFPVSGTAEGIVGGQRRSVSLEFARTSRPGVYALKKQWKDEGTWTLVIAVSQGQASGDIAQAIVEIAPSGSVASVQVPSRKSADGWTIPAPLAMSAIDADLRTRAKLK